MRFGSLLDARRVGSGGAMRAFRLGILLSAMACVGGPALAHHSNAMFDQSKTVVLKGVVTKFVWMNPHVQIFVEVEENGQKQTWQIGTNSVAAMTRQQHWNRNQFRPGEQVEVWIHPPRDGSHLGYLRKIVGADGKAHEVSTGIPDDKAYEKKPGQP